MRKNPGDRNVSRKRRKEKKGGDDGGSPGWMTTYGDMMSLLLAFFILIVSFSSIQESEFKKAMASLQRALGLLKSEMTVVKTINPDMYRPSPKRIEQMIKNIRREMRNLPQGTKNVSFDTTKQGVRVRISNPLLFDIGRANLKRNIYPVLDEVAAFLDSADFPVIIEGHTDNVPIYNEQFHSNWELSAARAVAVVEYFEETGLDPERFSAVAYSEYRPLESNETEEHRASNRRVEIFIPYYQPAARAKAVN